MNPAWLTLGVAGTLAAASIAPKTRRRGAANLWSAPAIGPAQLVFLETLDHEYASPYLLFWEFFSLKGRSNEELSREFQVYQDYPTAAEMRDQYNEFGVGDDDYRDKFVMGAFIEPVQIVHRSTLPPNTPQGRDTSGAITRHLEAVDQWVDEEAHPIYGAPFKLLHVRMFDPREPFDLSGRLNIDFDLIEQGFFTSIWNLPGLDRERFNAMPIEVATVLFRVGQRFDADEPPSEVASRIIGMGPRISPSRYFSYRRGLGGRATFTVGDRGATPEENRRLTALFGDPRKLPGMLP
jgi:hypothetical protein